MTRLAITLLVLLIVLQTPTFAKRLDDSASIDTLKVKEWIEKNAIQIKSIQPQEEVADLSKLIPILKDKKVIGLGDATHGTKEFFLLKHRLIEYLIKNMNCTAVTLELPLDYGVHINSYVKTGEGNIDKLLESVWWWHKAEEIKNFLIWLKDYNLNLPAEKKVSFYGFDSQVRGDNTYQIFEYFKKVDDHFAENIEPLYNFMAELYIDNYSAFTPYRVQRYNDIINTLNNQLEVNKESYIAKSSREEYFITKARINTFAGLIEMKKGDSYFPYSRIRAKINAENIRILSEIQDTNDKIVVWAHNGHITSDSYVMQEFFNLSTTDGFYGINRIPKEYLMGYLLRKDFDDKYFNIGFEFYKGSFTVIEFQVGIKEFTVSVPESNTLPNRLNESKINGNCYFIELNKDKMDRNTLQYFSSEQFCHEIGAAYVSRYVKKVPINSYNAIIFFRTTSGVKLQDR